MRTRVALSVLALALLNAGCSLVEPAVGVATGKAAECVDDCSEKHRNRRWAEQAWEQCRKDAPDGPHSPDFADGFKEGFADYLYAGGDGEPPPLPPRKYRAVCYQTPQGYGAIEDWFAGFRRGAAEARQGGYRQWITGPTSLSGRDAGPAAAGRRGVRRPPLPPPHLEDPPPRSAKPKDGPPTAALPPPAPVQVAVRLQAEPSPPAPPRLRDERPRGARPAQPPARRWTFQAQFRPDRNAWQIDWHPSGRRRCCARPSMGPEPFAELMQTVLLRKQENDGGGGRHVLTMDNGSKYEAVVIDDVAFENLAAFLTCYCEGPAE